jgi:hypothetical protein
MSIGEVGMKRIWVAALIFLLFFIALGFATFRFGMGQFLARCYENAADKGSIHQLRYIALLVGGLFAILCSVAGFFIAKKRGRSLVAWTVLCLLFNLWGLIILLLLPVSKGGRGNL